MIIKLHGFHNNLSNQDNRNNNRDGFSRAKSYSYKLYYLNKTIAV